MIRASVIALAIATSTAAYGQAPARAAAPRSVEINLPLTLDGRYLGDLPVTLTGEKASLDATRFLELLRPEIQASVLGQIQANVKDGKLTPEAATSGALDVRYDTAQQQIEVTVPVSARTMRVIQVQGGPTTNKTPVISPATISALLNVGTDVEYIWENPNKDEEGMQPVRGFFDFAGRVGGDKGVAFISRQSFDTGGDHLVQRNESRLIYDDVRRMMRFTAGDLQYRGSAFQGAPRLAGVGVERYFGLEPNFVYRPIAQNQIELDSSATVEVQINGVTIRQLRLDPGRYDLRNLPLTQGSNNVDIVIRDASGRVSTLSSRRFFDNDLLGEGITDISFAAGVRSEFENGGIGYSKDLAGTGFVLHGFSPVLTAGANAQADERGGMVGGSVIWASPLGIWRVQAAGSHRKGIGSGMAANLGYRASGRFGFDGPSWSLNIDNNYYSPNFSTLADFNLQSVGTALQPFSTSHSIDFQVSSDRWAITGSAQYNRGRGSQEDTASAIAGVNYAVSSRLTLGAFGTYSRIGNDNDIGALFQLTFRFSRENLARATYDTARQEAFVSYRHSESNNVGDTSYEVGVRRNAQSDFGTINGNLYHAGNRFEATLQHDVFSTANLASGERIQTTRASIASSIVFADGKFGIGRPVQESFAIISPHETLKGKTIKIDPSERGYRARTDFLGPAVVPDVNAYGNTFLYYDVDKLPIGYDLGSGDFALRPQLYSGYKLTVGSDATYTVLAHVSRDGEPLALIGGKFQSLDRPSDPPVPAFTNRNGRLAATGLKPGRYRLELSTDPAFTTEVTIKKSDSNLINLGDIRIDGQ
jgi:outer membrane usher protein